MSLGHPAGVPAKVPFSVISSIANQRKSLGHQLVDLCLSRQMPQGHPASVPGIFFQFMCLFCFLIPSKSDNLQGKENLKRVFRFAMSTSVSRARTKVVVLSKTSIRIHFVTCDVPARYFVVAQWKVASSQGDFPMKWGSWRKARVFCGPNIANTLKS